MSRTCAVALAMFLLACSGAPPQAVRGSSAATEPSPPSLRLPTTVGPTGLRATLTLDPGADTFDGAVALDLAVSQPTRLLWLDATDLAVRDAYVVVRGARLAARVVPGGADFLGFAFDRELPAGPARLHATYTGRVSDKEDRGVFRMKEGESTFLFTQFENIDARRAFPCFDEPSFKYPWQLTLRVRAAQVALSNTSSVEETVDAGGWKTVRFAETKPLPAYLVAFAVGPFELVDAGRAGKNATPIRLAVPPGKGADAAFARRSAPVLLGMLEDYFGIPYPYDKLDLVSVPNLVSFGAMENAGLITVTSTAVVAQPADDTPRFRNRVVAYMAHEMAHQWFGDLVTPAWWDDIWLNEGFATWMGAKITHRFDPSFGEDQAALVYVSRAMDDDGLLAARKVRQEIVTKDDIANAFDSITYDKGGGVLEMFESWLGEAAFQRGVRHYLEKFAHGNATSSDFLTALGEGAGVEVRAAFSSFLDQPGIPLVTTRLLCDANGATLALTQERSLPIGSRGSAAATWQIPFCARYGVGAESGRACTMLSGPSGELSLPKLVGRKAVEPKACPEWVMPKAEGHGYYRVAYTSKDLDALLDAHRARLTPRERLSVVRDLSALVQSGRLPLGDVLARLADLAQDPSPFVQSAAVDLAGWLRPTFVEPGLHANAARFVRRVFGPRAERLGWRPAREDSAEVRGLRIALHDLLVTSSDDPKLLAPAADLASKWLDAPDSLELEVVPTVLRAATVTGDKRLFDRILDRAKHEPDTQRRVRLVAALAGFREPSLVRASLALLRSGDLDAREATSLLFEQDPRNLPLIWELLKQDFDAIVARVPNEMRPNVFWLGAFCDEEHRADVQRFLEPRQAQVTGAPRALAQALEAASLCIAQKREHRASLEQFLAKQ